MKGEYLTSEESMGRKLRCSCGKICFHKKDAQTKKNYLERKGNQRTLRIYQCPDSDWWHLTKAVSHNDRF